MGKIYLTLHTDGQAETFEGTDGKTYSKLWTITRKLTGNMQMMGATINGELRCIDATVPTEVKKIPRGAKPVDSEQAEELWKRDTHYFGE